MERRRDPNDGHYHQQRRGYDVEPLRRPGEIHDKNNNCASNPNHNNHREPKMRSFRDNNGCTPRDSEVHARANHNDNALSRPVELDWKCLECGAWNYPDLDRCDRCGTHADAMFPVQETKRRANEVEQGHSKACDEEEVDEFGRQKKPAKKQKKQPDFPPSFDEKGSAFVFDSRSGMFYEKESDFFYDPQSKLYYGNKQSAYFRYDADAENRFIQVQKVSPAKKSGKGADKRSSSTELDAILGDPKLGKKGKAVDSSKPKICINLKTKKLPGSSSQTKKKPKTIDNVKTPNTLNPQKRQHQDDISKWSERQEEMKASVPHANAKADPSVTRNVSRTAKGEPICTLCKRKFPNLEKLEYHERVSKLHAENLKKLNEKAPKEVSQNNTKAAPNSNYVDRAQQRRDMYGIDHSVPVKDTTAPATSPLVSTPAATVKPSETLGSTNVGNKMLQKLGWQSGKSLGRRGGETALAQNDLKNDWERIEALASQHK